MLQIKVRNFEGPLDLLLKLVEEEKVDIISLPISQITDQYWEHIESGRVDPDDLADYIVIGSRLLYAKSCAVVPSAAHPASEPSVDKVSSADLADTLTGYKKFKEAIQFFQELEDNGRHAYGRPSPLKADSLSLGLEGITLDNLVGAVQAALSRHTVEEEEVVIDLEMFSLEEKTEDISSTLKRGGGRVAFRSILEKCSSRTEIVVLFLAVLEMIKKGSLWAEQEGSFGEIELVELANSGAERK